MREYRYVLVDVFTKVRFEGNPLAVFPSGDGVSNGEMQRIARELNLSETAFILKADASAAARVRIFTPRRELDFAGHPTIGSAYVVTREGSPSKRFMLEENVGLVAIDADVDASGYPIFWLTTPKLTFFEMLEPEFCARLLNVGASDIATDVPPQFVSAGSPLLFVCVKSPQVLDRAELQQAHLQDALGSVNSVGTFVFARKEPQSNSCFEVYSRMFAPQTGIPEDPATGGATGPMAGYMVKYGMLPRSDVQFTSEQGTKMGRRSFLHVRVVFDGNDPMIKVGGSGVPVAEGRLQLI